MVCSLLQRLADLHPLSSVCQPDAAAPPILRTNDGALSLAARSAFGLFTSCCIALMPGLINPAALIHIRSLTYPPWPVPAADSLHGDR